MVPSRNDNQLTMSILSESQQTVENSSRHGNTRPPDLPPEKPVCRSRSNSLNWTWNNRLAPNRERSMSRLYIVSLLYLTYMQSSSNSVSCSVVSDSLQPHGLYVARQSPVSMGFSRQEYWSGLSFPSPEDLPDPGVEPWSPALHADSLPFELQGSP